MRTKALALIAASSLASSVGSASAVDLGQVSEAVDLEGLAELILTEYLNQLATVDADDGGYALAIGFTFGVAFAGGGQSFSDALSEGIVLTGADPASFGNLGTIANTLAGPGLAGVRTVFDAVAFDPPDQTLLVQRDVSPD
jgi:hypothetical protein